MGRAKRVIAVFDLITQKLCVCSCAAFLVHIPLFSIFYNIHDVPTSDLIHIDLFCEDIDRSPPYSSMVYEVLPEIIDPAPIFPSL